MASVETVPPRGWGEWWAANVTVLTDQTLADWLALPEGTRAQLIDGEIIVSPAPSISHQIVVARFAHALTTHVERDGLGLVLTSPLDVRLTDERAFQPDVVFVSTERLGILGEQEVESAPDLVMEALSPSTGYYDLTRKKRAYEEAGVREYWVADPGERTVTVFVLKTGGYQVVADEVEDGPVASVLLDGFSLDAARLFRRPGT